MSTDAEGARAESRRLEAGNPLWIVVYGVYSREFVRFPRFGVRGGALVAARNPDTLPSRLRRIEDSARSAPATRTVINPPRETATHP